MKNEASVGQILVAESCCNTSKRLFQLWERTFSWEKKFLLPTTRGETLSWAERFLMFLFQCFPAKKRAHFEYTHPFWVFVILVVEMLSTVDEIKKSCASVNVSIQNQI